MGRQPGGADGHMVAGTYVYRNEMRLCCLGAKGMGSGVRDTWVQTWALPFPPVKLG